MEVLILGCVWTKPQHISYNKRTVNGEVKLTPKLLFNLHRYNSPTAWI